MMVNAAQLPRVSCILVVLTTAAVVVVSHGLLVDALPPLAQPNSTAAAAAAAHVTQSLMAPSRHLLADGDGGGGLRGAADSKSKSKSKGKGPAVNPYAKAANAAAADLAAAPRPVAPVADGPFKFVDVMDEWLPWQAKSTKGWSGPCFTDLNGDGLMDYVNLHHYGTCANGPRASAVKRIKVYNLTAENAEYTNCDEPYEWEFGIKDAEKPGFLHVEHGAWHFRLLDPLTVTESRDKMEAVDIHGFGIVDLDRDGRKDFYGQVGASSGTGLSDRTMNTLFWGTGEPRTSLLGGAKANYGTPSFQWSGGRFAALEAGLESRLGRSRHLMWVDADQDGLLDVFLANIARADGLYFTSQLYVSEGAGSPRKRVLSEGALPEIGVTAMLTDLDGDGWAREVILGRPFNDYCKAIAAGKPTKLTEENEKAFTEYCKTYAPGTFAMYKLDGHGGALRLDDNTFAFGSMTKEMAVGDLDSDGRIDFVECHAMGVNAFPSSLRQPGELPSQMSQVQIDRWPKKGNYCDGMTCVVNDFDLDGVPEILYVCGNPGHNRLYERTSLNPLTYCHVSAADAGLSGELPPDAKQAKSTLPLRAKGVSTTDVDGDGFADVYLAYDGPDLFLHNRAAEVLGQRGEPLPRYVALWLEGVKSNKEAVGASVLLWAKGVDPAQPEAVTPQVQEVRRSGRVRGFDDERLVFGLGPHGSIDRVEVRWPLTDTVQVIPGSALQPLNNIRQPHLIREEV